MCCRGGHHGVMWLSSINGDDDRYKVHAIRYIYCVGLRTSSMMSFFALFWEKEGRLHFKVQYFRYFPLTYVGTYLCT